MSQAGIISVAGGGGGGTPVQTISSQNGTATPIANNIVLNAYDSTENNDNGIVTKAGAAGGDPPGTGAANEVDVYLTNRQTGPVTTTTDVLTTILTFPLGVIPGVYKIWGQVVAFDTVSGFGGSYDFSGGYRTDGATATELGIEYHDDFEDLEFLGCDIFVSTTANNVIIQVQGLPALPLNSINWSAVLEYRKVS